MWTLVTGGSKHLGAKICQTLASEGLSIVVHYNKSENEALNIVNECIQYGIQAHSIQGDFSTLSSVQNFIQRYNKTYPKTKNLINNVGPYLIKPLLQTSMMEWNFLYQTNLFAPLNLIQGLLPSIIDQKGSVINIGMCGIENHQISIKTTAYRMAKQNLLYLTKALAIQLAKSGVRVNMVSPGYLDISESIPNMNAIPMGRLGSAMEVARVIAFLLKEENSYITGQNIEVAGGVGL